MDLEAVINRQRARLNENDLLIWEYIAHNRRACERLSIEGLGAHCHVSRTTIMRFAQKLGFAGYSELKMHLRLENEQRHTTDAADEIAQVCAAYQQVVDELAGRDCTALFARMAKAENLYIYSAGMVQSAVAKEFRRIFLAADLLFYHINGGNEVNTLLANITERDLVILLSVSGESEQTLSLARALRVKHVPTVSITKLRENTLAQLCDERFYIGSAVIRPRTLDPAYESTTSFFILVELLFLKYLAYRDERAEADEAGNTGGAKLP